MSSAAVRCKCPERFRIHTEPQHHMENGRVLNTMCIHPQLSSGHHQNPAVSWFCTNARSAARIIKAPASDPLGSQCHLRQALPCTCHHTHAQAFSTLPASANKNAVPSSTALVSVLSGLVATLCMKSLSQLNTCPNSSGQASRHCQSPLRIRLSTQALTNTAH